jgi:hypothetical protein
MNGDATPQRSSGDGTKAAPAGKSSSKEPFLGPTSAKISRPERGGAIGPIEPERPDMRDAEYEAERGR